MFENRMKFNISRTRDRQNEVMRRHVECNENTRIVNFYKQVYEKKETKIKLELLYTIKCKYFFFQKNIPCPNNSTGNIFYIDVTFIIIISENTRKKIKGPQNKLSYFSLRTRIVMQ